MRSIILHLREVAQEDHGKLGGQGLGFQRAIYQKIAHIPLCSEPLFILHQSALYGYGANLKKNAKMNFRQNILTPYLLSVLALSRSNQIRCRSVCNKGTPLRFTMPEISPFRSQIMAWRSSK